MDHEDDVPIQLFSDEKTCELFREATEVSVIPLSTPSVVTSSSSSTTIESDMCDIMDHSTSFKVTPQSLHVPPNTQSSYFDDYLPSSQEDLVGSSAFMPNHNTLTGLMGKSSSSSPQKDKTMSIQSSNQNDQVFYISNKVLSILTNHQLHYSINKIRVYIHIHE